MKKFMPVLLITALLSGCSSLGPLLQFASTPTPPPPTETFTPAPTVTQFPTQDLFATSTFTPTSIVPTSDDPTGEVAEPTVDPSLPTETPEPLPTFAPPSNINSGTYFTPTNKGFLAVLISNNSLYWNEGPCMPRSVKFSAFVEDLVNTDKVLLFMRLREKKNTLNLTDWGGGAIMLKADNGSFNYTVTPRNISKYYSFKDAWLEYQLVALTEDNLVIGRTQIYDRNISLIRCMPVP
ncbi:MAG: hypothetical protein HXY35_11855 [Chloroflexi bacterium]|nr:hypothetical protein [Chloroflexota bacterium]